MGAMSDAAKVGAAVLIVLVLMVGLSQLISGRLFMRGKTYYILVRFEDGTGLRPGMPLKLAGTDIGWVEKVGLTGDTGGEQLTEAKIRIETERSLYEDAAFLISQDGLIGEKSLVVQPGSPYFFTASIAGITPKLGMPLFYDGQVVGTVGKTWPPKTVDNALVTETKFLLRKEIAIDKDAKYGLGLDNLSGEMVLTVRPTISAATESQGSSIVAKSLKAEEGAIYFGHKEEDITALIAKASQVIESVDTLLAPDQLGGTIRELSSSLSQSLDRVNVLLEKAGGVVSSSEGYVIASLQNVHAMSANFLAMSQNLEDASITIGKLANDPAYADTITGITHDLNSVSSNLSHLSSQLDLLVSDPAVQQDAKDSVRLTKETLQEAKATISRFQQTMDKADGLIDSASGMMENANGLISDVGGAVGDAKGKMDQVTNIGGRIEAKASLNVRAYDQDDDHNLTGDDDYVGDINVAVGYGKTYVSAGADNIGADNNWNFLLGYGSLSGLSFRGGVYRGELGLGAAYYLPGGGGAEVMAYDTENPKLNTYGYVPLGNKTHVVVGIEDVTQEQKASVGIGVDLK